MADDYFCPQCAAAALQAAGDEAGWRCVVCAQEYPILQGVPWLVSKPLHHLQEWRQRFLLLIRREEEIEKSLRARLDDPLLSRAAWTRLATLADGHAAHRRNLHALLAPLQLASATSAPVLAGLQTRLPSNQDLTSYYVNLHRDWVWGQIENSAALNIVRELAGGESLGRLLVPGAGAGRLAYDLHQELQPNATVALDINPLLVWSLQRLAAGEALSMVEFPLAPRSAVDVALTRELRAPAPARAGLAVLLGDVLQPPFAAASFDTVVTPWLIDILPVALRRLAERIAVLLPPGGRWINFGSLAFAAADPAEHLTAAEVAALIADCGFTLAAERNDRLPYMQSPASRHGRVEETYSFVARRGSGQVEAMPAAFLPDWAQDVRLPVPHSAFLTDQALKQQVYGFVAALVDGQRSTADIAAHLVEKRLMAIDEALPAVRNFLLQLHDQAGQRQRW
jgi:hypothetical protein